MHYIRASVLVSAALLLSACSTILTPDFGLRRGNLSPCPPKRDCVSTQSTDVYHHIDPIKYGGNRYVARIDLLKAIYAVGEARVVSNHSSYLRVEYPTEHRNRKSSQNFYQPDSAVDDVEFYFPPDTKSIEMRSIARLGLFEVGANRARLEKIRALFAEIQSQR